jgi:hypothetical protein
LDSSFLADPSSPSDSCRTDSHPVAGISRESRIRYASGCIVLNAVVRAADPEPRCCEPWQFDSQCGCSRTPLLRRPVAVDVDSENEILILHVRTNLASSNNTGKRLRRRATAISGIYANIYARPVIPSRWQRLALRIRLWRATHSAKYSGGAKTYPHNALPIQDRRFGADEPTAKLGRIRGARSGKHRLPRVRLGSDSAWPKDRRS